MSLLNILTGGKNQEANAALDEALKNIQSIHAPTAEEMKYMLQQYVQAGVMTPDQAQTYLQQNSALESENVDQTGTNAQQQAIAGLMAAANAGGLNPQEQAQMQQIMQQLSTQEKGANDAVLQNQAARGTLTGGQTLAAQLQNNQNATVNANQNASATAGQAYQNMLNELTSAGSLGSGLQGQQNTQANTVASATDAINRFNAAQQQNQENYNVSNRNNAQAENLGNLQSLTNQNTSNANQKSAYDANLPQQVFQNNLAKEQAAAGIQQAKASTATGQGQQNAAIMGGLTGLGVTTAFGGNNWGSPSSSGGGSAAGAGGLSSFGGSSGGAGAAGAGEDAMFLAAEGGEIPEVPGPDYKPDIYTGDDNRFHIGESYLAKGGGSVPGQANVQGNSPKNDTVPTMLSPGEVVLPRTVAQHPTQDRVMSFLHRMRKPQQAHPDDVATVLHALGRAREG